MFLLSPVWLAVLAAAAVPVLLHLISRGRYRRVRVGSVRLIPGNPARRGRRFRPSQLLLLAVRCALLAALALALAQPRSLRPLATGGEHPGWILASPEALALRERLEPENRSAYARLDRLVADGAELRLLAAGAPRVTAELPGPDDRPDDWSLLREADALAAAGVPFHVLTVDRVAALRGERPRLARRVEWDALRPAGLNRWIEAVGAPESAGIPVVVGTSDPDGTYFRPGRESPEPDGTVTLVDGGLRGDDDSARVPATVRVGVVHDPDRSPDADYVRAAVAAVAGVTTIPMAIAAAGPFDIRFHLSAGPVPADWLETLAGGGILVSDGTGERSACDSRVQPAGGTPFRSRLHSPAPPTEPPGAVIWADELGHPVLDVVRVGDGLWYRLHGRLDPRWSDLPLGPALPAWIASLAAPLVRPASAGLPASDLRRAAPAQRLPATSVADGRPPLPARWPEHAAWLLVLGLLALERALAARSAAA